jgi:pyruvate,water dikinase
MPYLNISPFASLFNATNRRRQDLLNALESTLFMQLPNDVDIPLIPFPRLSIVPAIVSILKVRLKQKIGLRQLSDYLTNNPSRCRKLQEQIQTKTDFSGLYDFWNKQLGPHLQRGAWTVLGTVENSTDYAISLRRELESLVGPRDANLLIGNLSATGELLPSLGPLVGLSRVASGKMNYETYLSLYGHRGPHEFEVYYPRPVEDQAWMDIQLERFQQEPINVEDMLTKQRGAFHGAWERLERRQPGKASSYFRRIQESAQRALRREQARSEYIRDRWMARKFALRIAELAGLGDEVFFLSLDELLDFLKGDERALAYLPARMETYRTYKSIAPYPALICGRFDPFAWADDPNRRSDIFDGRDDQTRPSDNGNDEIRGAASSVGKVEGLARVLRDPTDGDQLRQGEILVAVQTDIAWTLLFGRAAAVVTDVGAPLSHAAIVARELGITAVVGCGDASMRIKTGDRVRVDGGRGLVKILD